MATLSASNITTRSAELRVSGLQYPLSSYDYLLFQIYQGSTNIYSYKVTPVSEVATGYYLSFENEDYLGNNWFSPATSYTFNVVCRYNGTDYTVTGGFFTTKSISAPSGSITPTFTNIRDQGSSPNCVAMSLEAAMQIFKAKQTGITYEDYSISYIFGNDAGHTWGMYFGDACAEVVQHGSPRWELVHTGFPDNLVYSDARTLYNNNNHDAYTVGNATLQAFDGYNNIDFYDCAAVKSHIQTHGYFMFNFRVPNNFYGVRSSGIVPQPDSYSGANHSIALIGLTTIGGKAYWIAQNSWGTDWGAGGIGYIPYDWGIGVLNPGRFESSPCIWTVECYAPYNTGISNAHPSAPSNVTATSDYQGTLTSTINWSGVGTGITYTVFARKTTDGLWYIKGRTTSTSLVVSVSAQGTYQVKVLAMKNHFYSDSSNIATFVSSTRPETFKWTTAKIQGQPFNLTAVEWNRLIQNVKDVHVYKVGSYNSSQYPMSNVSSGQQFYASRFNEVRYAIGSLNSTGINNKYKGDTIYASDLNLIVDKLNGVT